MPRWLAKVDQRELATLRAAIASAALSHRGADLESLLRPSIRLALKPVKTSRGVVTRFGGHPDLPRTFVWPSRAGTPLAFVAQLRLDELATYDLESRLPKRGVLSVFAYLVANGDDYGERAAVHLFPDVGALVRTVPPHAAARDGRPTRIAHATPRVALTLPAPGERVVASLKLTAEERERYHDRVWMVIRAGRAHPSQPGAHQVLGWPDATSPHAAKGWELLGQIDSDDRLGLTLGDVETLRLHIATTRLAKADVRAVRASLMAD